MEQTQSKGEGKEGLEGFEGELEFLKRHKRGLYSHISFQVHVSDDGLRYICLHACLHDKWGISRSKMLK